MSTRNVLIAVTAAAVISAATACGTSTSPPSASNAASTPTAASASAATTPSPAQPTPVAGGQSACPDLGGTVGPDQTCHVRSTTAAYTLEMSFPLDYPDQKALTDVLTQDRDSFVDWVAKFGPDGQRGRPYEHVVTAETYRSGTPDSGTQSLVLEIQSDAGLAHEGHPDTSFAALNYDLGKRTAITFDTLFKPDAKPLEVLNPIVLRELQKNGSRVEVNDLDVRTYQNFAITDDAVIFFFAQDQVIRDNNGPRQVSVPRTALASLLA